MEKIVNLEVMSGKDLISVDLTDINYISILKHGCRVHMDKNVLRDGKYGMEPVDGFLIKRKLREIYDEIKESGFDYAHNSYIVNLRQIRFVDTSRLELILDSGERLKISRSRKEEFEQSLLWLKEEDRRAEQEEAKQYRELEVENRKYREIIYELKKNIEMIDIFYEQADHDEMKKIIRKLKDIMRIDEV